MKKTIAAKPKSQAKPKSKTSTAKPAVKSKADKKIAADASSKKQTKPVAKPAAKKTIVKTSANVSKKPPAKSKAENLGKKSKGAVTLVPKAVAQEMMDRLCKRYPDADCELDFGSTFQLLTSVILSAQTTDVQVNKCTPGLFKKFPTAKALAEANIEDVKDLIKPTGYYNAKAANIQKCAQALVEKFGGEVPETLEELTQLPGVGRKTANVVLGVAFGVPGWTVDTHVQRLSGRLGLSNNTEPHKIEIDLQNLYPEKDWTKYSITLIWHGRRLCYARNPNCAECPINDLCPSAQV
ncbi:endonuclease III [Candidatus Obscuribacterales bacterium]|nr:endonuclease III [Candidatus Obscuribacterales bacterium]